MRCFCGNGGVDEKGEDDILRTLSQHREFIA
jgi:hypothetical protein